MPYVSFDPNTEQTRFDLTAMMQEWSDFTQAQCGYEELDSLFVARLTAENHELLARTLWEESSLIWDAIDGVFAISADILLANGGKLPLTLEQLDLIWHDCFNTISDERFEAIQETLSDERRFGLVS